jgi:hypothetical protein
MTDSIIHACRYASENRYRLSEPDIQVPAPGRKGAAVGRGKGEKLRLHETFEAVTIAEAFPGYGENPLGMALRGAGRREGLTQRQLAEMTGMPQRRHISEMETGKRQIGKERARRLAEALRVSDYRFFL